MKKLVLFSGGTDSAAVMLDYIEKYGTENIVSLGFNYGQRHFLQENGAAIKFCEHYGNIPRSVLSVPIDQIGGCSLIDDSIPITTDMNQQRSTVVPQRNALFLLFAAAFAEVNGCDVIAHGACAEDYSAYRDCRDIFFELIQQTIQAGRIQPLKGSEDILDDITMHGELPVDKLDIKIDTPLINEKKEETLKRIVAKYGIEPYKYTYTCYNGKELSCGKCPSCVERLNAFHVNGLVDPIAYNL